MGAQSVKDNRHIDQFLNGRTVNRLEPSGSEDYHQSQADHYADENALLGDEKGPFGDGDAAGDFGDIV